MTAAAPAFSLALQKATLSHTLIQNSTAKIISLGTSPSPTTAVCPQHIMYSQLLHCHQNVTAMERSCLHHLCSQAPSSKLGLSALQCHSHFPQTSAGSLLSFKLLLKNIYCTDAY